VNDPGDSVGPGVDRGVGDGAAAGVPDEHDFAGDGVDGIDDRDYRVDMITQRDSRAMASSTYAGSGGAAADAQRWRAGTIWSHDEPSSQKPGIRMMCTVPTLSASIFISEQSCRCGVRWHVSKSIVDDYGVRLAGPR
jgi:hypothetical protein